MEEMIKTRRVKLFSIELRTTASSYMCPRRLLTSVVRAPSHTSLQRGNPSCSTVNDRKVVVLTAVFRNASTTNGHGCAGTRRSAALGRTYGSYWPASASVCHAVTMFGPADPLSRGMVIDVCLTFFAFSTEAAFFPKRGGLSPERPSSTSTASPVRVAAIQKVSSAGIDDETPASLPLEPGQGGLSITWLSQVWLRRKSIVLRTPVIFPTRDDRF